MQDIVRGCGSNAETAKFHMKELAANGLGGVNLEKYVGRALMTVVFEKKDVHDSNMDRAMELGENLVRYCIKFDK